MRLVVLISLIAVSVAWQLNHQDLPAIERQREIQKNHQEYLKAMADAHHFSTSNPLF